MFDTRHDLGNTEDMINFSHLRVRLKSFRGFTLLELLVVISIIGILVAMGAVSYTTAQIKARDARRRSDMQNWAAALEQYYSANSSSYPTDTACSMGATASTYLPGGVTPTDPKGGTFVYSPVCAAAGTGFCLCAQLESATGGNSTANGNATCNTLTGSGTYYCVKSQQ